MERILVERKKVLKAMVKDFIKKIKTPLLNGQLFREYKISDEFLNEFVLKFRNDKRIVKNTIQEIIENKDMMIDYLIEKEKFQNNVFGISLNLLNLALEENGEKIYSNSKDFIEKIEKILETEKNKEFSFKNFFEIVSKKGIDIYFLKNNTGRYNKAKNPSEFENYCNNFLIEKITDKETRRLKSDFLEVIRYFSKMVSDYYTYSLGTFGGLNPTPYGLFELEEKKTLKYKINLFLNDFENEKTNNFFGIKEVFLKLV